MNFDPVEKIAAAILYEGYILYPYRPSAIKNRQRWNFGTLYPQVYAEAQRPQEPFRLVAECLVVGDSAAALDVRVKFLQLVRPEHSVALTDPSLAWDEAVERTSEHCGLRIGDLLTSPLRVTAGPSTTLQLMISAEKLQPDTYKLHIEVRNETQLPSGPAARREEALPPILRLSPCAAGCDRGRVRLAPRSR